MPKFCKVKCFERFTVLNKHVYTFTCSCCLIKYVELDKLLQITRMQRLKILTFVGDNVSTIRYTSIKIFFQVFQTIHHCLQSSWFFPDFKHDT